jgi:hypothetical protein
MSYTYTINKYYKVKKSGEYPNPTYLDKNNKIFLSPYDVLTGRNGKYSKHTGNMVTNILINNEDIELCESPVTLSV